MNADKEKQQKINEIVRYIAGKVFSIKKGTLRFTNAYDKLYSRIYLDHGININDRMKAFGKDNVSMFDVLHKNELNLALNSAVELMKMYEEAIERKKVS